MKNKARALGDQFERRELERLLLLVRTSCHRRPGALARASSTTERHASSRVALFIIDHNKDDLKTTSMFCARLR